MAPKKNQKMSLGTFLQDENYGSWADEMEDMPLPATDSRPGYSASNRRDYSTTTGGMANAGFERRDTFYQREQLPLPSSPPFTAHLANLSFDVTQGDIQDFFRDCQVTNVRIVEDKLDRKPKGFGYVEFGTLDGLKTALTLSGSSLAGRQVRISVADPPKGGLEQSRDFSDWTRKGPLPDLPSNQRRVSDRPAFGGNRSFDNMSDAGSERGTRRGFGGGEGDGKSRDFSNWERKGPLSPAAAPDLSLRSGGRQGSKDGAFRRNSPSWGEGRSQDGSRPPRRDYAERPERPAAQREPTAAEMDNQWRARMRPDAQPKSPTPETSNPPSPAPAPAPTVRPKLNLQKRTVSEADPTSPAANADSKASPFGAARPVDTAAKEREVEEKRQIAIRQKKEADDKAKAERAEEKKAAKEKTDSDRANRRTSVKDSKEIADDVEAGDTENKAPPKFELLRRQVSDTNDMVADDDEENAEEETVAPEQDKAVKPREVVRDAPNKKANGAWRKGDAEKPAESETVTLEEDGWSTVSKGKKQQNSRRNQPQRAIAS